MDWCKLGILLGFSLARRRRCSGWSTRPFFVWNGEERLTALVVAAGVQFTGEEGPPLDPELLAALQMYRDTCGCHLANHSQWGGMCVPLACAAGCQCQECRC